MLTLLNVSLSVKNAKVQDIVDRYSTYEVFTAQCLPGGEYDLADIAFLALIMRSLCKTCNINSEK